MASEFEPYLISPNRHETWDMRHASWITPMQMCIYCLFSWRISIKRRRHKVQKMIILYSVIFLLFWCCCCVALACRPSVCMLIFDTQIRVCPILPSLPRIQCLLFSVHCLVLVAYIFPFPILRKMFISVNWFS